MTDKYLMSKSYLYVIADNENGPIKLGVSGDPVRRRRELQTGHPRVLRIYYQEEVDAELVYYLENNLHKDINYHRALNEWFNLSVKNAIGHLQFTLIHYEPSVLEPIAWNTPVGSKFCIPG